MGVVADKSGIQFRLFRSRGPAVGPRTQVTDHYIRNICKNLLNYCNLSISDPVIKFYFKNNEIIGFATQSGKYVKSSKTISQLELFKWFNTHW